ncbi:MAG: tetratricopeptide (TPR) repeat protein [Crocinitomicaceae bacterium]|jgi:tetratricopeptide (TPR) repeat protein
MQSDSKKIVPFELKLSNSALAFLLIAAVTACLFPTLQNDWVNWDDPAYVLQNLLVQDLSNNGVYEMFATNEQVGLYHPITLLSLSIDYYFWETDAFGYHLTNFLFHTVNVLLVFALLKKLKFSPLVAFIGALLFGMHPMHVESVAWISARKDVLYTFFFLISIITYLYYIRKEGKYKVAWYVIAIVAFTVSLLSKSLGFTLPIVLLLVDYLLERKTTIKTVLEKVPFVILAIIAVVVAQHGQEVSNSMSTNIEFSQSILMSSYNTIGYGLKAIVPINLSIFHPFPTTESTGMSVLYYGSIVLLICLLFFMYRWFKTSRVLFFGLSFYLITIGPVTQIIPFGKAISSERYTYVPYIGLCLLIALGIQKLLTKYSQSSGRYVVIGMTTIWLGFLAIQSNIQSRVWQNSEVLWSSVIVNYPDSEWAYMSRGMHRLKLKDFDGAKQDLDVSISIRPLAQSLYERGYLYEQEGMRLEAFDMYFRSVKLEPSYAKSHLNLAVLYSQDQNSEKAFEHFKLAVKHDNSYSLAHFNLGISYKMNGNMEQSLKSFTRAIELEPNNPLYIRHRGVLQFQIKNYDAAIKDFERAMVLEPKSGEPYLLRSKSYFLKGDLENAKKDVNRAQEKGLQVPQQYLDQFN